MAPTLALDSAPAAGLTGWRAHQELIDALPYVDPLTTSEQRAVDHLIEEEVNLARILLRVIATLLIQLGMNLIML